MQLSVVLIAFNEEHTIQRCLRSVEGLADEIIVVDSLSTDRTAELATEMGARLIQQPFLGYGLQKQFAVNQACYDWILSLDADEELSEELRKSVRQAKKNPGKNDAFQFNRLNFYCGKPVRHCGWYPDKQIRFFNRTKMNWDHRDVHEKVHANIEPAFLKGDLHHYTCRTTEEHQIKERKYAVLNAEMLSRKGKSVPFLKPWLKGAFRFFKTFLLKKGFLDGKAGFQISKTLARSSFLKYQLARELLKKA